MFSLAQVKLFLSDNQNMNFSNIVNLCIDVICNWKVIVATILMIIFIEAGNYVITYRKKPKVTKVKETKAVPAPAPAEKEKKEEPAAEEAAAE